MFIGTALNADHIQIWKDVAGVMTADPLLLDNARTIKNITFDEAEELALCGAKILHHKTISPARKSGTKISIFNTRKPDSSPTIIQTDYAIDKNLPKSITSRNNLCVVKIHSNDVVNDFEFYKQVFDTIYSLEISPLYFQGRHENIFLILENDATISEFEKNLRLISTVITEIDVASISLIGYNIVRDELVQNKLSKLLGEDIIRYSLTENRNHSLTFVIDGKYLDDSYQRIHDQFVLR